MPSAIIPRFQYDPTNQVLTIELSNGSVYCCHQVPGEVVAAFRQFREKEVFFNKHISGKYSFDRVRSDRRFFAGR